MFHFGIYRHSFQLGCQKDHILALYSLLCSLMVYRLTPKVLQLNFMLMIPSYTNCIQMRITFSHATSERGQGSRKLGTIMA